MNPEQLNATHGIADMLRFVAGNGGRTLIEIDNGRARALISLCFPKSHITHYHAANRS